MIFSRFFPYFSLSALLFLIVPGVFIYQSVSEIAYVEADVLLVLSFSFFLVSIAIQFFLHALFKLINKEGYILALSSLLMFYVFISGLLFPVSLSSGLIPLAETPVDVVNLVVALLSTLIIFLLYGSKYKKTVTQVFSVMLAMNLAVATYGYILLWNAEKNAVTDVSAASIYQASSRKNIFVISFDGVDRDSIFEWLKNDPSLQKNFNGFTFYQNVSSSSPSTSASIFAELLGNQNFKVNAETLKAFNSVYSDKLLTNVLDQNGIDVSTYGVYTAGFKNSSRTFRDGQLLGERPPFVTSIQAVHIFHIVSVRIFTRYIMRTAQNLVVNTGLIKKLAAYLSNNRQFENADLYEKLLSHKGPDYSLTMALESLGYDSYVDKLSVKKDAPVAHFMHYTFSHFPNIFNDKCIYRGNDSGWYDSHQNKKGVDDLSYCVLLKINDFLNKAKALGVYENSIIVFKSDHGAPSNYFSGDDIKSFRIHNNEQWGYSRYTPFLLVKPEGGAGDLSFNDQPVLLDDLAYTLCHHSGIESACKDYPGYDLLAGDIDIPADAKAYYFVLKERHSTFAYDTHVAIELNRKKDFINNMHWYFVERKTQKAIPCNKAVDFSVGKTFQNGLADYKTWAWWKNKNTLELSINTTGCLISHILEIDVKNKIATAQTPEIYINGLALESSGFHAREDLSGWVVEIPKEQLSGNRLDVKIVSDQVGKGDYSFTRFYPQ